MLAGDGSPGLHADAHDLLRGPLHPLHLGLVAPVEEDVGVQVSVSGVEDVGDPQVVAFPDARDLRQNVRELRARDGGVLYKQVRGDPAHGAEGLLPALPQGRARIRRSGPAHLARAALQTGGLRARGLRLQTRLDAVELHHQRGRRVRRVAGREDALFHGPDGGLVDDFERRGEQPVGDDRGHGAPRVLQPLEDAEQGVRRLRQRKQLQIDFHRDAEAALRSHEEPRQVEFAGVEPAVSQVHPAAVREHHVQPPDVAGGDTVLEAVGPARVLGDIAADAAGALRRGIRGVVEAVGPGRRREMGVDDSGLDARPPVVQVEFQDPVHARRTHHHGPVDRERAAGETRPRAAGHEGHACLGDGPDHPGGLVSVPGQHRRPWRTPVGGEPVGLVDHQPGRVGDDSVRPHDADEFLGQPGGQARYFGDHGVAPDEGEARVRR